MDIPLPGMVDHPGSHLYETPDYRVYGWPDALPPECSITDHVEEIVGKASYEKPCLNGVLSVPYEYRAFDLSLGEEPNAILITAIRT